MIPRPSIDAVEAAELFSRALRAHHALADALAAQALDAAPAPAAAPPSPHVPSAPAPPAYMVPSLSQVSDYKRKGEAMAVFPMNVGCERKPMIRPEGMVDGPEVQRTPLQQAFVRYDMEWKGLEEEWQQLVERLSAVLGPEAPTGGPEPTRGAPGGSDLVRHVEAKGDDVERMARRVRALRCRLEV